MTRAAASAASTNGLVANTASRSPRQRKRELQLGKENVNALPAFRRNGALSSCADPSIRYDLWFPGKTRAVPRTSASSGSGRIVVHATAVALK
jgi:hypothetical protein